VRVTVVVPRALRRFADGHSRVDVDVSDAGDGAATVAAVLAELAERHPGVCERALDERGEVRRHVNLFVDGASVRGGDGLATPVVDGAEVVILPAVSGGAL
jgi:molybdopterin synthase sulfur carrier subunit